MRRPNNRLPADITAVFGSTGTRKTTGYVMPRVDAERGAVVIWDAKNEYQGVPGVVTVYDRAELVQAVRSCRRLAFHAPPDEFAFWCRVVWARGDALVIAGREFGSRLLVGTGKYKDLDETGRAIEALDRYLKAGGSPAGLKPFAAKLGGDPRFKALLGR